MKFFVVVHARIYLNFAKVKLSLYRPGQALKAPGG
jgi:hypothetical protein